MSLDGKRKVRLLRERLGGLGDGLLRVTANGVRIIVKVNVLHILRPPLFITETRRRCGRFAHRLSNGDSRDRVCRSAWPLGQKLVTGRFAGCNGFRAIELYAA